MQSTKIIHPGQQLVVAGDFRPKAATPQALANVRKQVMHLARRLQGTGATIKLNSILRACGYDLIQVLHDLGVEVCADLKLNDVDSTLRTDGELLSIFQPDMLTVAASTGSAAMKALKAALPNTEIWGVTVPTSMDDAECQRVYGTPVVETVAHLAKLIAESGLDGIVCSSKEARMVRGIVGPEMTINTPGIRLDDSPAIEGDTQKRVGTPRFAIEEGADRIVVGKPITQTSNYLRAAESFIAQLG